MTDHKTMLPTASDDLFLTDGGLETTLVFLEGFDLPCFAAFDILKEEKGYQAIRNYYRRYLQIAKRVQNEFHPGKSYLAGQSGLDRKNRL
jgi:S-methylmethionine-dependent homocysteine/selenocysteine methylase